VSDYDVRHPFHPDYQGKIAAEYANPRYPNRVQEPSAKVKAIFSLELTAKGAKYVKRKVKP
jgi:hypothetical protein